MPENITDDQNMFNSYSLRSRPTGNLAENAFSFFAHLFRDPLTAKNARVLGYLWAGQLKALSGNSMQIFS